jgi:hypothetical protein
MWTAGGAFNLAITLSRIASASWRTPSRSIMRLMHLHRAHADSKLVSNQLVRTASHQPVKNVALARTEGCDAPDGLSDIAITPGAVFFLKCGLDRPSRACSL